MELTAVALVELSKIERLQNHIGKFSEADSRSLAFNTLLHRFLSDHRIHGEMFTDVAQKRQYVDIGRPVEVVRHDSGSLAIERQELGHLFTQAFDPASHYVGGI